LDNPATESSNAPLNLDAAASLFATALSPEPKKQEAEPVEAKPEVEATEAEAEAPAEEQQAEDDPTVTVKIDGKDVEVKLSELKNGYQRQADYTRKTMEVSEQRKAAEAESQKARTEREAYSKNLQTMQVQLEAALQQQQQTDWAKLLESDPVEYLKQQHLAQTRQATLQQVYAEQQKAQAQQQAEQEQARASYLAQQQEELLAKLPDWKDEAKAKAERTALRDYLLNSGYDKQTVDSITDAKAVVLARKAMLYDRIMDKASAAAKKVSTLPTKVEKPGVGENPGLDRRSAAFQRLSKSGKVEDAASLFAGIL
jgi:hypothetical protein